MVYVRDELGLTKPQIGNIIIATEQGWNLYVCSNGGAKPQHGG